MLEVFEIIFKVLADGAHSAPPSVILQLLMTFLSSAGDCSYSSSSPINCLALSSAVADMAIDPPEAVLKPTNLQGEIGKHSEKGSGVYR